MNNRSKSLLHVLFISLVALSLSVTVASAEVSTVLYDGNALDFATPPDVVAYANTVHVTPPSEFQIATSGSIWRYHQWIALMNQGNWVEAETTVETTTVSVQFWGDTNDGWARVLVDGSEVWTGNTYGSDPAYPGGAFVKYLEISGLDKGTHTIRVENMGISGPGGGNHVTIYFFGLMAPLAVGPTPTPTPSPTPISEKGLVAYYPFDGDVRDYSGNNNHGTNNGAVFVSGVRNQALSFDGKDDYVRSPVNINQDNMPQMTMVVWAKADEIRGTVISQDDGSYDRTIDIDNRGGGDGWSAFSGSGRVLGFHPVTTDEWTFLAAVYDQDAETVTLYVNDRVYQEKGKLGDGKDYTNIGSNPGYGVHFPGDIDEVRIYNYALSQSEINSMRQGATLPGPTPTPTPTPSPTPISERGLVAYYPFDNDVRDYSGNNNHGTPKGNMAFTTAGVVGNAAAIFDGKSYIEVKDSDSLDLTEDFTFAGWLNKKDAGVGGWAVVFSKGDTSSLFAVNSPYALYHDSNGIYPSVRVASQTITSTAETNFNEWYFVTVTKDGSELKFYINGELKDTKTSAVSIPESDTNLLIGIDPPGTSEYFRGSMDDLRIYNVALSQSEINAIYLGATAPAPTPIPTPTPEPVIDRFNGLTFESRSKATGSIVQIPLTLNGVRDNIGNMDMTLRYDSSVLVATEVVKGSLTSDSLFDYNIIDGTIKISFADKDGFSGDGSIAHVRFNVVGAEGSSTALDIASLSANRADLTPVNIPTKDGVFKVISLEESKGDAAGDGGELTALDALYALQMAVGKIPEDLAMDVNGDGSVTSIDARQILRNSAKLE
ncbi:LamG-like jellyroll fold domain-containing protein [Methanococcoides sp. NM1]|uniref:LamG-like jellyroll fold domain-containing protein n=1 Tax=Methanococcoides sp. NM1 TaxID=1201013 RepID=UPI001438595A|nr:LamG-like jellyroll fold domain-containing protein [Methanococcoides sp. NM1]